MDKVPAALIAATSVTTAQLVGGLKGPTPSHPGTAAWYARLRKPSFTPTGPVFGIAWTILDGLLGYAGYRLLSARPGKARSVAVGFWLSNPVGIAGFSWVPFGRRRLDEATGVSAGMIATSAGALATAAEVDNKAALAILPLVGWVLFAFVLQEEVGVGTPESSVAN